MPCLRKPRWSKVPFMTRRRFSDSQSFLAMVGLAMLMTFVAAPETASGEPPPASISAFDLYIRTVESRLEQQHRSPQSFLAAEDSSRLHRGELIVERLTPSTGSALPGALLHDWRGTAFAAGAKAADFEKLIRDFDSYPRYFSPQVVRAKIIARHDDQFQAVMRVRQRHVITVVMDTTYDIAFGRLDARHGYSLSRSTRISEIDSPGTGKERALNSSEEHGFLWRLYTYWSYEERDDGLYLQIESVSLTRSVPAGLGWLIGPFVESIPRESLEFTLRSACNALRKNPAQLP
jgi:hypothetical protein